MMKQLLIFISVFGCFQKAIFALEQPSDRLQQSISLLRNYDDLKLAEIMVVATPHLDQSALSESNQESIQSLMKKLSTYKPTKIVLEWEPKRLEAMNKNYRAFLNNEFDISSKSNEVYQIGFQLAKLLKHPGLYLFDNQTEYIGSLEDFSFKKFADYANSHDAGFFDRFEKQLTENFQHNQKLLKQLPIGDQITIMNSPEYQRINEQRMHMYEIRVGIQKSWMGSDWLGRWYQRNIRMVGNVLKLVEPDDRLLIIVGDNHKWVLDSLFDKTPDLRQISSWEYLNR